MLQRSFCIALGLVFFTTVDCRNANPRFWWLFPEFDNGAPSRPVQQTVDSFLRGSVDDAISDDQDGTGQLVDDWDLPVQDLDAALELGNKREDDSWGPDATILSQIDDNPEQIVKDDTNKSKEEKDDWDTDTLLSPDGKQNPGKSHQNGTTDRTGLPADDRNVQDAWSDKTGTSVHERLQEEPLSQWESDNEQSDTGTDRVNEFLDLDDGTNEKQQDNSQVGRFTQDLENNKWTEEDSETGAEENPIRQSYDKKESKAGGKEGDSINHDERIEDSQKTRGFVVDFDSQMADLQENEENDEEGSAEGSDKSNSYSGTPDEPEAEEDNDAETQDFVIDLGSETVDSKTKQEGNPEISEDGEASQDSSQTEKFQDAGNEEDNASSKDTSEDFNPESDVEINYHREKIDDADSSWGNDDTDTAIDEISKDRELDQGNDDIKVDAGNFDEGSGQDSEEVTLSGSHQTSDDEDWGILNPTSQELPAEKQEDRTKEDFDEEESNIDKKEYSFEKDTGLSSWDDDSEVKKDQDDDSMTDQDNNVDELRKPFNSEGSSLEELPDARELPNTSDSSGDGNSETEDDDDESEPASESELDSDVKSDMDETSDNVQEPMYLTLNSEGGLGRSLQREPDDTFDSKETEDQDKDFSDFSHGTIDTSDDYGGIFKLIDVNEVNPPKSNDVEDVLKQLGTEFETDDPQTSGDAQVDPSDVDEDKSDGQVEDLPEDIVDEEIIATDDNPELDPGYNLRCDPFYNVDTFNVTLSSQAMVEQDSSVTLECVAAGQGNFRPLTLVTKWEFRQPSCGPEDASCADTIREESFSVHCDPRDKSCTTLNYKENPTPANFTTTLSIKEVQRNQTGLYRCIVYATGCKTNRTTTLDGNKAVHIRVYSRANYTAHIAIMTVTCVLLIALLLGLTFLMRRVMKRHRDNYRLIIADTNIQYQPIKALELPPTGVFMNTTVAITRDSIASSFSSKSSFVTAEETA